VSPEEGDWGWEVGAFGREDKFLIEFGCGKCKFWIEVDLGRVRTEVDGDRMGGSLDTVRYEA
jgi:hypothetical protein